MQVTRALLLFASAGRFVGGVREEFGPTPHVIYVACPSSDAVELRSALLEAALALQPSCQELNVAPGITIGSADPAGSGAARGAVAASPGAAHDAGAHADARSQYIQMTGSAQSMPAAEAGPRLRLLTLQVRPFCLRARQLHCSVQGHDK
jgi:hypothetical protein